MRSTIFQYKIDLPETLTFPIAWPLTPSVSALPLQVSVMLDAVDDITRVEDFLSSSETHILEDIKKCMASLQVREGIH